MLVCRKTEGSDTLAAGPLGSHFQTPAGLFLCPETFLESQWRGGA
jgi:hypothetical protein